VVLVRKTGSTNDTDTIWPMDNASSAVTAQDVRDAIFEKPPWGKRGYDEKSVKDFLQLAARRLDGRGHICADDVRGVRFPKPSFGKRGIDADQVDRLLADIAETIADLDDDAV
jgi:DivIVA domain-containing protein